MPYDYDGTTNEFRGSSISPELRDVIDKVTKYATSSIGGARGPTAAQGSALKQLGTVVGGIEQQRMQETGATQRLGMMSPSQAGALKEESARTALKEKEVGIEGAYKGALTAPMPSYMKKMFGGGIGAPEKPKSVLDEYPNLMDYFK